VRPAPDSLVRVARVAERIVTDLGRAVSWLGLAMVLTTAAVVVLRKFFDVGFIWMQESVIWMHAAVFMLAAGYTLALDEHVRVDIFYRGMSPPRRLLVDTLGTLLLLVPTCVLILVYGWHYVAVSWTIGESSPEAGGLPGLFLLKSLIILTPALLLLESLAFVVLRWARVDNRPDGTATDGPGAG
jgi:TRAP-type mannitol/chloroaromatic compound transport system permease small subunit